MYFDQPRSHAHTVVISDPLVYPYWSLDYFYFSRFYHPYSVVVAHHDPWFYPYPGWYYGYRPGPRGAFAVRGSFFYPWHSFGFSYVGYRPWRPHYVYYPVYVQPRPPADRVREIDDRLRAIDARGREQRVVDRSAGSQTIRVRSDTMTRHRIAEDRAAAASRRSTAPRSTPTRSQQSRPAARTRSPATTAPRSRPSRTREPATRSQPRRQPPTDRSRNRGIDLSSFTPRQSPRQSSRQSSPEPQRRPPSTPAPAVRTAPSPQPRTAPSPRAPETRSAPAQRSTPSLRRDAPRASQDRGSRRQQRER